jgi:hypothetical protein
VKRPWLVAIFGIVVAVLSYLCVYFGPRGEHRSLLQHAKPELAWLKQEYHISDAQFARITELHNAYQPKCMEMCRRIDEKNSELESLLAATNTVTLEIKRKIAEVADVRRECQAAMLQHFYEVSQAMPPEQGKRYLAWIWRQTLTPAHPVPTEAPRVSRHP